MASTNAHGSITAKKNDGGVIVKAGNTDGSVVAKVSLIELAAGEKTVLPVTVAEKAAGADNAVVTKAVSSGTFAYQPATGENFLLRMAGDNAEKINGVSSDVLAVGGVANEYNWDGIMELNTTRSLVDGSEIAFGNDNAAGPAFPSRAVPGELVFMDGGKTPERADYKAKDSAES